MEMKKRKIKSVKRGGNYYSKTNDNKWELINDGEWVELVDEEVILNCPLFEIEYEPERWRAEEGQRYYSIVQHTVGRIEDNYNSDDKLYSSGNYFKTKEEAETVLAKFKQVLNDFHKSKLFQNEILSEAN